MKLCMTTAMNLQKEDIFDVGSPSFRPASAMEGGSSQFAFPTLPESKTNSLVVLNEQAWNGEDDSLFEDASSQDGSSVGSSSMCKSSSSDLPKAADGMVVPGEFDVIVRKGRRSSVHSGNQRYMNLIASRVHLYEAEDRDGKTHIISDVINHIQNSKSRGSFYKFDPDEKKWVELTNLAIREKISQSFRDALHSKYRSSSKAKNARKKIRRQGKKSRRQVKTTEGGQTGVASSSSLYEHHMLQQQQTTALHHTAASTQAFPVGPLSNSLNTGNTNGLGQTGSWENHMLQVQNVSTIGTFDTTTSLLLQRDSDLVDKLVSVFENSWSEDQANCDPFEPKPVHHTY